VRFLLAFLELDKLFVKVQLLGSFAWVGPVAAVAPYADVFNVTGLTQNAPDAEDNVFD
jgi:hypothetical protein